MTEESEPEHTLYDDDVKHDFDCGKKAALLLVIPIIFIIVAISKVLSTGV